MTALHTAAQRGRKEICEMILEKAPGDINAVSINGASILHYATLGGNKDIISFLLMKLSIPYEF